MKKKIFTIILTLCIICSSLVLAQENTLFDVIPYDFKIFWNGENLNFDSQVLLINGQTYVPLRDVAEEMNMNVNWNGENKEILMTEKGYYSEELIFDAFRLDLPETAEVLNYAYTRYGKDIALNAKIFFEESDLEYMKKSLEAIAMPLPPDEMEDEEIVLINLSKKYDWWDISSPKDAQYTYNGFMEGVEVKTIEVWGLICEDNNSDGYILYIKH